MQVMKKQQAIELLGGTVTLAAKEIGISYQAVNKWPDDLPARIADRVHAALARQSQVGQVQSTHHTQGI
jgi:hypothetical protein